MTLKKAIGPMFILSVLLISASFCYAAIPEIIGYEGRLTDQYGTPITASTQFTFKIYSAETGGSPVSGGTTIQTINPNTNGVFSTVIAVPDSVFNGTDRWLGVAIGAESEMIPRIRVASAAYAYKALSADSAATGGTGPTGATGPKGPAGNGTSTYWTSANGGTDIYNTNYSTGNVGIGTTVPAATLQVVGSVEMGHPYNQASGADSVALGASTIAYGNYSTAMGDSTVAYGDYSTAMGEYSTTFSGANGSTAMGSLTSAFGIASVAMGSNTMAMGHYSTALGQWTSAEGVTSTAMGNYTRAVGDYSAAMGKWTTAGYSAVAFGLLTSAEVANSISMGYGTRAHGTFSTAMGHGSTAFGDNSTALGHAAIAGRESSISMGLYTSTEGVASTTMGSYTTAGRDYSVAMGLYASTEGSAAVAMGPGPIAVGDASLATGYYTYANGQYSTSMGFGTYADAYASLVIGRYNIQGLGNGSAWQSGDPVFVIGKGSISYDQSNAVTVLKNGNVGIGTHIPQTLVDIVSTTEAFMPPRMTQTQRLAISALEGMMVFDTTNHHMYVYTGEAWEALYF
jgi:hypothetical protein